MLSSLFQAASLRNEHALGRASHAIHTSLERLATGKRINRASDDPAGMIASEDLRASERSIQRRIADLNQEDAFLGAREGAQSVLSDMLIELKGLVVSAANRDGLSDSERQGLQDQASSIIQTIDGLSNTTTFKHEQILQGFHSTLLGARPSTISAANHRTDDSALTLADLQRGGRLNLLDGDLETAQQVVELAAGQVNSSRAAMGARAQSIQHEIGALQTELENTSAARSQIEDADFAKETAELVRNQVLQDAAVFSASLLHEQMRTLTEQLLKGAADNGKETGRQP